MTRRQKTIAALLGLGVVGAGGALLSRAQKPAPAKTENPLRPQPVRLITAEPVGTDRAAPPVVSGQLEAWRSATVSAQVGERVAELPLTLGQRVGQGELLARLDDRVATAQLAEAGAGLARATAGRRQLEAEYRRAQVETLAAIDAARAQVAQATSGVVQARAATRAAAEASRKARSATRAQELAQAEATLRRAEADARFAESERVRYRSLFDEGVIARQAKERVEAACEAALAGRDVAASSLSLAREGARREDVAVAASGLAGAEAAVRLGEAKREEAEAALRRSGARDALLDALRRQIVGLRAEESRADARVRQARLLVEKHRIVAPFAGRVLEKRAERGESLASGAPVARIGELGRLKATFAVPESSRAGFAIGTRVTVTVDAAPGRAFVGRVHALGAEGNARSRTFPVEVALENPGERLLPGQSARLRLGSAQRGATRPTLPIEAVASDRRGAYVFTVREGIAVRVPVALGELRGERVEVSGVNAGTEAIETPQRVAEGQTVEVIR